jgi:hypothetical protein
MVNMVISNSILVVFLQPFLHRFGWRTLIFICIARLIDVLICQQISNIFVYILVAINILKIDVSEINLPRLISNFNFFFYK